MADPQFPTDSLAVDDVLAAIRARRDRDADWKGGRTFSLVYHPDDPELDRLHEAVALEYLHENALNPFAFPSLTEMEGEVVEWGSALVHGPGHGRLTSGGTESIFLAVQTMRDHARHERGIAEPVLLTATTAHPAFAKACKYLDVEQVRIPVRDDGRADVTAMADAIDDRTGMVVGSSPVLPVRRDRPHRTARGGRGRGRHPVPRRRLPRRLPAAVLGSARRTRARRGTSGSTASRRCPLTSTSTAGRSRARRWSCTGTRNCSTKQFFLYDDWPGGLYGSATTAGTRAAAPIAAAWATMRHLGEPGYTRLATGAPRHRPSPSVTASRPSTACASPTSPTCRCSSSPPTRPDIGAIGDVMDDRGWHLDRQQGGLHLMLWPYHANVVDQFLADLRDAVAEHGESRGVEATYGGIA